MAFGMNDFSGANAQTSVQQAREAQLLQQLNATRGVTDHGKIEKSAREFEAMLLGSWLQQAEQSFATVPGADDDEDAAGRDQMMSLGVQNLSQALVASGGIGIAKMIAHELHQRADREAESAPGQSKENHTVGGES